MQTFFAISEEYCQILSLDNILSRFYIMTSHNFSLFMVRCYFIFSKFPSYKSAMKLVYLVSKTCKKSFWLACGTYDTQSCFKKCFLSISFSNFYRINLFSKNPNLFSKNQKIQTNHVL